MIEFEQIDVWRAVVDVAHFLAADWRDTDLEAAL